MLFLLATSEAHYYTFVLLLLLAYSQTGHRGFFSASTGTLMAQSMLQSMRWRYGDLLGLQSARPLYDLWMSTYRNTADAGFCEARRLAGRILAFCKQEDTLYFLKKLLDQILAVSWRIPPRVRREPPDLGTLPLDAKLRC